MSMYQTIRSSIEKNPLLFKAIRIPFTPIRLMREQSARKKMAAALMQEYASVRQEDPKIVYFGIPQHSNLGDIAQTYCTRKWLAANYPEHKVIEIETRASFSKTLREFLGTILNPQDIFVFQSGYCTRDKNPDHIMHLEIMSKFPDQKAVILPQTVLLKSEKDIANTRKVFARAERLLFIARDQISAERAQEFVPSNRLACFPDIVTSLIGSQASQGVRSGVLVCVRNDAEKFYDDSEIEEMVFKLRTFADRVDVIDTNVATDAADIYRDLENVIREEVRLFSEYQAVITDRYHGTIFSMIANTPVIVIKTGDHKVTSGVDWFKGLYPDESVSLAPSTHDAVDAARAVVEREPPKQLTNSDALFRMYYEKKLKALMDECFA